MKKLFIEEKRREEKRRGNYLKSLLIMSMFFIPFFHSCGKDTDATAETATQQVATEERAKVANDAYTNAINDLENELNREYGKPGLQVAKSTMTTVKMKIPLKDEKAVSNEKKKELSDLVNLKLRNALYCTKYRRTNIVFIDLEVEEVKNKMLSLNAHIAIGEREGVEERKGTRTPARPYLTFGSGDNFDQYSAPGPLAYYVTNNIQRAYDLAYGQWVYQNVETYGTSTYPFHDLENPFDVTSDNTDFLTDKYLWNFKCSNNPGAPNPCIPRWYTLDPNGVLVLTAERLAVDNLNSIIMNGFRLGLESLAPEFESIFNPKKWIHLSLYYPGGTSTCCNHAHIGTYSVANIVPLAAGPDPEGEPCNCQ